MEGSSLGTSLLSPSAYPETLRAIQCHNRLLTSESLITPIAVDASHQKFQYPPPQHHPISFL